MFDFVSSHFRTAFGVSLLHLEGGHYNDVWCKLWHHVVLFKNCHYDLPSGAVGHNFIESLSLELFLFARGDKIRKSFTVFICYVVACSHGTGRADCLIA